MINLFNKNRIGNLMGEILLNVRGRRTYTVSIVLEFVEGVNRGRKQKTYGPIKTYLAGLNWSILMRHSVSSLKSPTVASPKVLTWRQVTKSSMKHEAREWKVGRGLLSKWRALTMYHARFAGTSGCQFLNEFHREQTVKGRGRRCEKATMSRERTVAGYEGYVSVDRSHPQCLHVFLISARRQAHFRWYRFRWTERSLWENNFKEVFFFKHKYFWKT